MMPILQMGKLRVRGDVTCPSLQNCYVATWSWSLRLFTATFYSFSSDDRVGQMWQAK